MAVQILCPKCESAIDVSPGQAGARVECMCGNALEVPSFRELRAMGYQPHDAVASIQEKETRSRRLRVRGFLFIFTGLALILIWSYILFWFAPFPYTSS